MPFVQLTIAEGRPPKVIRELIRNVSETISTSLDTPVDGVRVQVHELPATHLGSGTQTLAERRAETSAT